MSAFPKYDRYKDSEVEWLGEIPAEWESDRVFSVFNERVERGNAGLPILNISIKNGVREERPDGDREQRTIEDRTAYKRAAAGDIAYNTMRMWQGAVGNVPVDGLISPAYVVARPIKDVNTRYYSYLFRSEQFQVETNRHSYGIVSDRNRLYWIGFKNIVIPIPKKSEQNRIVTFLDRKTAEIDALIAKKQRQIELLDEQRAILINRAVTRGLNPNTKLKPSGIEWMPEYPAEWQLTRIKSFAGGSGVEVQIGPFGGMIKDLPASPTGFKVYGQENTISGDLKKGNRWLEPNRFKMLREYQIAPMDILLTRKGSIGNAFPVPTAFLPGIIDSDTIRVRILTNALLCNYFLLLMKEAPFMNEQIFYTAKGAIIAGLNSQTIKNLRIPLPTVEEQKGILRFVDSLKIKQLAAKGKIEEQIQSLKTLRSTLIAHAVTGRIKV